MKKKIFTIVFVLISVTCGFVLKVNGAEEDSFIIDRSSWKADDSLVTFAESYSFPNKVIIIPVTKKNIASESMLDVQELYYYFAKKSGIGDLPFHYLVTGDGKVYIGNKLGNEARIVLSATEGAILIGYVQNQEGLGISSVDSLKNIILEVINKFAISPANISVKKLNFSIGERAKLEETALVDSSQKWQEDISLIIESLQDEYSPADITFKAQLVEVTVPEEEQEVIKAAEIKIKVKNIGNFNMYSDTASNIFVTRNNPLDAASSFYLAQEWDSPSRKGLLNKGDRLAVGEEREFVFNVFVPLYPPSKSEDFVLVGPTGSVIEGSEFTLALKIKKPADKIIEVTNTSVGYLNVRETPGTGSVVTKVSPGDRFLVLDYSEGYYKIEANGKTGWVVNMYVRVVSS